MVLQCRRSKRGMAIAAVNNHMECACMVSVSMIYICAPTAKGYTGVLNGPGVEYPNMEPATWYVFYYTPLVGTWASKHWHNYASHCSRSISRSYQYLCHTAKKYRMQQNTEVVHHQHYIVHLLSAPHRLQLFALIVTRTLHYPCRTHIS